MAVTLVKDLRIPANTTNVTIPTPGAVPTAMYLPSNAAFTPPIVTGVQGICATDIIFKAPTLADVDYFVTAVASGTGAKTYTLLQTTSPAETINGISVIPRKCITVTSSGATATIVLTVTGKRGGDTITLGPLTITAFSGGAATYRIPFAFDSISSIVQTSSGTTRNISFGTSNSYGLGFPVYCPGNTYGWVGLAALRCPATALVLSTDFFLTVGVPNDSLTKTVDDQGFVTLGSVDTPGGTNTPDSSLNFKVRTYCDDILGVTPTTPPNNPRYAL